MLGIGCPIVTPSCSRLQCRRRKHTDRDAHSPARAVRSSARSSRFWSQATTARQRRQRTSKRHDLIAEVDSSEPFAAALSDGRVDREAVIPRPTSAGLLIMLTIGLLQFVEQRLRLFQVTGVEPLGEPAIDWSEQVARLATPSLLAPHAGEARCGAQSE
jgi:hypothetical protein